MNARGRNGRDQHTRHIEQRSFRLAPIAHAIALILVTGGAMGDAHASQAFSPAWFGDKSAFQNTVRTTGMVNGKSVSSFSPQGQQQQADAQLQQSIANLTLAANGIAAQQAAQAAARQAAMGGQPTVPDGLGTGGLDTGSLASSWVNVNGPTQTTDANGKTVVDIQQTGDRAIANWQTFNVGKNTIVQFDQASADWAILNRITDPMARPSQIQGQIRAPGTVLIVNKNGIVFSGSSQINTRSLVAAAGDISDTQFQSGGLYGADINTPTFTGSNGSLIVEAGAQIATDAPASATQGGGYVLLIGSDVHNAGTITTPQGQTELAAGDNFIIRTGVSTDSNQYSTTRGNEIEPQRNAGSSAGMVENTGMIFSDQGDITLAGHDVQQNGVAVATTTVNTRGTIHLLNSAADTTGQIVLGPDALTTILLQDDGQTALNSQRDALIANSATEDAARQTAANSGAMFDNLSLLPDREDLSRIEIVSGGNIDFQSGSMTLATGGQIAASTGGGANPGGRIQLESGAQADVSGAVGVQLSMASNSLQINIQGNEQRDASDNRDSGALNNSNVWVDLNDLILVPAGTAGYATDRYYTQGGLLEVSGYLANTGHTIGEWGALGGTVTLASNEVVTQPGSIVNISGGSIDVQTGYMPQSWLQGADGRLYNASTAPADVLYTGVYHGYQVLHPRWGASATQTFYNPLIGPQQVLQDGYTVGRDAGALILSTPTAILEGNVVATAFNGSGQQTAQPAGAGDGYKLSQNTVAQAGSLMLGQYGATGLVDAFDTDVQFGAFAPVAAGLAIGDALPADRTDTAWFDAGLIDAYGLGGLSVATGASIAVDAPLVFAPGAEVKFTAPVVNIAADVTARGGNIAITNILSAGAQSANPVLTTAAGLAGMTLEAGVTIDTRGLWSNLLGGATDTFGLGLIDGGDVSIDETQGIELADDSVIDTSSGGAILANSKTQGGAGGDITLIADDPGPRNVVDTAALILNGALRAFGVTQGGALKLASSSVLIGEAAAVPVAGQLVLSPALFTQGFSGYDITGYNGVAVAPGAQVNVEEQVYRFGAASYLVPNGGDPSAALTVWTPPLYLENPVSAVLTSRAGASLALHTNSFGAAGPVTVGAGALLAVDPGQSIAIDSSDQITVDGTLRAPGGAISITGGQIDHSAAGQSIWIGGDAVLDVAGRSFTSADNHGRAYGVALSGGSIVLGAAGDKLNDDGFINSSFDFIVVQPGALLDASGSGALIDPNAGRSPSTLFASQAVAPLTLAGDGGSISMSSASGIFSDGMLRAAAGGAGAAGGTLNVTLETAAFGVDSQLSPSFVPRTITISQTALAPQLPADLLPGTSDPSLQFGQAQFSAEALAAGGFGTLSFTARDAILFNGDVNLTAGQSISFHDGALAAAGAAGQVTIAAPYVLLDGQMVFNPGAGSWYPTLLQDSGNTWLPSAQESTGTFTVQASLIDIADQVRFGIDSPAVLPAQFLTQRFGTSIAHDYAGFGNVDFISQGDIRFLQGTPVVNLAGPKPTSLSTSGNASFTAAQLYPASGAIATVTAGLSGGMLDPDGVIDIGRISSADPALPDSVLGNLALVAGTINQGGVVRAPYGTITLGTTQYQFDPSKGFTEAVNLLPGSITSASLNGLTALYGGTVDGVSWNYNGSVLSNPVSGNAVSLASQSINVASGALIDVSGGGELAGAGFISGRGGSVDVLTTALANANPTNSFSAAGNPVYAILPSYRSSYAPVDPAAGAAPGIGQQIVIPAGVPGLPAGTYTLLPASYALLPGAYRVELGKTASAGQTVRGAVATGTGTWLVDGYRSIANAGVASVLPTVVLVTPGQQVRAYSQYNETSFSDFWTQQAATLSQPQPVLPSSGGSLSFVYPANVAGNTSPALVFNGSALFQPASGGNPGGATISGGNLEIYASAPTPGFAGTSVDVADVNAIGAPGLTIGTSGNLLASGGDITLRDGVVLKAAGVYLISGASDAITLDPGAEIDTIGMGTAPPGTTDGTPIGVSGFAELAVSNGIVNFVVTPPSNGEIGTISIGAGAKLYSEGAIEFAAGGTVVIDSQASFGTANIGFSAGTINIGDPAAIAAATVPAGFTLTQTLLNTLLSGDPSVGAPPMQTLSLTASQSFNVFGSVDLDVADPRTGKADLDLVLTTPAIYGYGSASDTASLNVGTLTWSGLLSNSGQSATPGGIIDNGPGTGAGTLDIVANRITFGFPTSTAPNDQVALDRVMVGFSTVNLIAPKITANNLNTLTVYQASVNGAGTGGNLNLVTSQLSGSAASIMGFTAGGALTVQGGGTASATDPGAIGAEIDLAANTIGVDSTILLPSGKLSMTASGDIALAAGSVLDLAGQPVTLVDQTEYSWGGDVILRSANGNITQASGATIDVSAVNNNAGTITAQAVGAGGGQVALNGTLLGASTLTAGVSGPYDGGSVAIGAQTLASGAASGLSADFAALNTALNADGFFHSRSFDLKQGDLIIGNEVQAHTVSVSVDNGSIDVAGTIDASGATPGSITLAAMNNLTLEGASALDAHGTTLQRDSFGNAIDAENAGTISLTTTQGTLSLAPGAMMDVSVTAPDGTPLAANGKIDLNAPRTGETSGDVMISASGPVVIHGASSIALNAFQTYAPTDPDGTIIQDNGDPNGKAVADATGFVGLDQINLKNAAFMTAADGNPGLRNKLAGLAAYGNAFHLRPGVEIDSTTPTGNLSVAGDLDLSGFRYSDPSGYGLQVNATAGSGEPGALVIRSANDLNIYGSINDGFSPPPSTLDDNGWVLVNGQTITSDTPIMAPVTLAAATAIATAGNASLAYAIPIDDSSVKANAAIPIAVTTNGDIQLSAAYVTTAAIQEPGGTVIPKGTILASGTVIPSGSALAAGTMLPVSYGIAAMTIPAGTPLGFLGNAILSAAVTVQAGQMLPSGSTPLLSSPLPADGSGVLTAPYTVSLPINVQAAIPTSAPVNFAYQLAVTTTKANLGVSIPFAFTGTLGRTKAAFTATAQIQETVGGKIIQTFNAGDVVPVNTNLTGSKFSAGTIIPAGVLGTVTTFTMMTAVVPAETNVASVFSLALVLIKPALPSGIPVGAELPAGTNVVSSSFVGIITANTRPTLPNGSDGAIWALAPMLPQGDLSWSMQFVSGADLKAANTQVLQPQTVLGRGGNTVVSDPHYGDGTQYDLPSFSVIRTGTGDLSFLAGGNFSVDSLFGIYTAGTQSPAILAGDGSNPYNLPRGTNGDGSGTVLGSGQSAYETAIQDQAYQAYYPTGGGDLQLDVQGNATGFFVGQRPAFGLPDDSNLVSDWLWRQGGAIASQQTAWWINFGTYVPNGGRPLLAGFTGIGTLGGGNVAIAVGGDAGSGLTVAVASTGRVTGDGPAETGGGALTVKVGGDLNSAGGGDGGAVLTDLRGDMAIAAGAVGGVAPFYGRGAADDPRFVSPLTPEGLSSNGLAGGIIVIPGDGTVAVSTRGDLVLDGVGDATRTTAVNTTPFTATGDGVPTSYAGGGNSWFSLWTDNTAIDLFSAGGNLAPVVSTAGTGTAGPQNAARTDGNIMYPPSLNAVAASGNIYQQAGSMFELAPSPQGQLNLLAQGSIYGVAVAMSGANPSVLATLLNPAFSATPIGGVSITNVFNPGLELLAFGLDTPTGDLHANDPDPIRVYAATGDIVGLELGEVLPSADNGSLQNAATQYIGAKPADIFAGRDIVVSGTAPATDSQTPAFGFILNEKPTDVSFMSAGRDIIYSSMQIGGPGQLVVQAGRNYYAADQGTLDSVGPLVDVNQSNHDSGAGIAVLAGIGAAGPDYSGFANTYLNPTGALGLTGASQIVQGYDDQLYTWLQQNFGYTGTRAGAFAYFGTLPAVNQDVFVRQVYFDELNQGGLEFNDPTSVRFQSYVRGRDAIAALFPAETAQGTPITYAGAITMFGPSGIHTDFGGTIQTLTPGGQTLVGVEGVNPPATAGVLTQGSGDIDMYSLGSILLGQSRVMTTFGGDVLAWSATGDINAGRGSKTTQIFTPPRLVYDSNGDITLSPDVPSSGAGFATLDPIPEVPPGDMNLVAPLGTIDAGEAGIRVSGNVNLAALQVVNAANIQVQGTSAGLPVIAAVNVGALVNASTAATQATVAAQDVVRRQQASARQALPSIITVQVLGFGEAAATETAAPPAAQPASKPADLQSAAGAPYSATNPLQFVGMDEDFDPKQVARLNDNERRQLSRQSR